MSSFTLSFGAQNVTFNDATQNSTVALRDSNGDIFTNIFRGATGLRTAGHLWLDYQAISGNTTIDESTYNGTVYGCTCAANITMTLPAAATFADKVICIKKLDSTAFKVILDGNASETIAGKTTFSLYTKEDVVWIHSDGSNWQIIHAVISPVTIAKTADFTVDDQPLTEFVYIVTPAATTTATLPAVSGLAGRCLTFKRISGSTNTLVLDGASSETIDGATTRTSATDRAITRLVCDGSAWHVTSTVGTWS